MAPDISIRAGRPEQVDAEAFARYVDTAADGLFRTMLGRRSGEILARAYLVPGHDLSYERTWFADAGDDVAGMLSGYGADVHRSSDDGVLVRAAGVHAVRMIGFAMFARGLFSFINALPADDWYVQAVAVDPRFRGSGIGSLLLDHAETLARSSDAARLALDVAVTNDGARRLYERRGMAIEATSPGVPFGADLRVQRMTKAL